jgi:holo-[acyl-carrier protein] synthase
MIIGTGTDIVEVARVSQALARHSGAFEAKVFTVAERLVAEGLRKSADQYFAGRWAAKEAIVKALGTGFGPECGWQDIEILNDDRGKPIVTLSGDGATHADTLGIRSWHLSISHEKHYACAMAIAEG